MPTTISGDTGVSQVQDGIVTDGKLDLTANSAEVKEALNASGTAPIYACRAWVNFDGTGTVSIRASGNVSSITDNGVGDHTVNFTTAITDANYSICGTGGNGASTGTVFLCPRGANPTTSAVRLLSITAGDTLQDVAFMSVAIFR